MRPGIQAAQNRVRGRSGCGEERQTNGFSYSGAKDTGPAPKRKHQHETHPENVLGKLEDVRRMGCGWKMTNTPLEAITKGLSVKRPYPVIPPSKKLREAMQRLSEQPPKSFESRKRQVEVALRIRAWSANARTTRPLV